jgi:hypothetical protein
MAREQYAAHYGTARLRELAGRIKGSRHGDLWRQFQILVGALSGETTFASAREHLALPAFGSFLWSPASTAALNNAELTNHDFLEALRNLAFTRQGKVLRPVDYKNLGAEELGGVYESLLALSPEISADGARFTFAEFAGSERKMSGSYYTPDSLVQCLLDSALDPVVEEAIKGKTGIEAEKAILSLKVCDPAVGSGHFLVGAAHRLARHLARVRAQVQGESEPSPLAHQQALRDVIGHCLYGVDVNSMAAELCRVSLWLEALEPGKPLSFLDHHIRVGNSLLGTTPELIAGGLPDEAYNPIEGDDKKVCSALKKRNKKEREGQMDMLHLMVAESQAEYNSIESRIRGLDEAPDDTIDAVKGKADQFNRLVVSPQYRHAQQLADAWCAAFVWKKDAELPFDAITTDTIRRLEKDPDALSEGQRKEIERLAAQYRFFHWHLAFPEVFSKGGFDIVLGNPPWDTLSPDAKEFFSSYEPQVRFQDRDGQQRIITELLKDQTIFQKWEANCRDLYALVHFLKHSGRYRMFAPGNLGKGDFNIYRMFIEAALSLTRRNGHTSQIVPEGLYNGANCMAIRRALYETSRLDCLLGFENTNEVWFPGVHTAMKFCLYAAQVGRQTGSFRAAFNIRSQEQLAEVKSGRFLNIPVRLIKEFSPDALAIMELGSQIDIDIATKMYRWPAFGDVTAGLPHRVYMCELHMGNDRGLFDEDPTGFPLYEGRMVDQFDYRAKGYRSGRGRAAEWKDLSFASPDKTIQPQWYIPREKVPDKCVERMGSYRIGFCDVASPTNERTLVTSIIPPGCLCGHKVPTICFEESDCDWYMVAWVAIANSYAMDFIARKKVSLSLTYTILDSLPFPRLNRDDSRTHGLVSRCLRLSCTGREMIPFWNRLAAEGWVSATSSATEIPGELDDEARLQIHAEIDAIVARDLFGLTRHEMEQILTAFPTQQRYQEEQYGEFRSRRLILEAFEQVRE